MSKISSYYSEKEIVGIFKRADTNQNRIKLIQELTLLGKSRIIDILKRNGCEILPSEMNKTIRKELMQEVFIEMYYDGKSDFAIALKLGVSETTIGNLRRALKLAPNRGKKIKKEPAVTGE